MQDLIPLPSPEKLLMYLGAINLITFIFYGLDKYLAKRNMFRISEKNLLLLGLFGGTPAAIIARIVFRHKTRKRQFIARFWIILILQVILLAWYLAKYQHHIFF